MSGVGVWRGGPLEQNSLPTAPHTNPPSTHPPILESQGVRLGVSRSVRSFLQSFNKHKVLTLAGSGPGCWGAGEGEGEGEVVRRSRQAVSSPAFIGTWGFLKQFNVGGRESILESLRPEG